MAERNIRLLIVVASGRGWASRFGHRLACLTLHLGMTRLGGRLERCATQVHHGAYLVKARNDHLKSALAGGFTHMLSLDDDMTFPADSVERMLAHDKAVVTCNYRKKYADRIEFCCTDYDGEMLVSTGKTGLERIGMMGMGITLIDLDKIRHIPGPYFAVIWNEETGEPLIEDGFFSALLAEYDVEIWCDHDLSQDVGHVGEVEFRCPTITSLELVTPTENGNESKIQAAG